MTDTFEELKKKANYTFIEREVYDRSFKKVKKTVWRISREFMWDSFPSKWNYVIPNMKKDFPHGDYYYGDETEIEDTPENHKFLKDWIDNKCQMCGGDICWFEGDKRVSYYCLKCGDESPFVKGAWAYM